MANERPSFQFYPRDFLADTTDMTAEEVGAYWLILCRAWMTTDRPGYLPNDPELLARLGRIPAKRWPACAKAITGALKVTDDGKHVYSKRMAEEWQKQNQHKATASENGKKGAAARWGEHGESIATPSENNGAAVAKNDSASASASAEQKQAHTQTRVPARVDAEFRNAWTRAGLPASALDSFFPSQVQQRLTEAKLDFDAACVAFRRWSEHQRATGATNCGASPKLMLDRIDHVELVMRGEMKLESASDRHKDPTKGQAPVARIPSFKKPGGQS